MLVVSYLAGIPPKNKNLEKPAVLKNFINGVNLNSKDRGVVTSSVEPIDCDVAVLQGFVHEKSQNLPHLQLRKNVLEHQRQNGNTTVIIDSNLFLYRDPGNTKKYLRYSYDGVFPTTGNYCNDIVDPARWEQIKYDLQFDLQPWRLNGRYILLCAQRDGGWSMGSNNVVNWVRNTVAQVRQITKMPIHVRLHPGDSRNQNHVRRLRDLQVKLVDSKRVSLLDSLQEAHATVVYNSSPAVASAIEGVPTFITDPNPRNSQAYGVAHINLNELLNPQGFDRSEWILRMAQMHWNQKDLKMGKAWEWMRKFV
jgi:hypothetical protein